MNKIILDLCGGTGSWSKPYKEAGYDVRNITLPKYDVRRYTPPENVYGILAAPPCTMFSDARTSAKLPRDLEGGWQIVEACLRIIRRFMFNTVSDQQKYSPLKFWALENPWYGRLKWFLGYPPFVFNPYDFGDNYKKKTAIWGYFNEPIKNPVEPIIQTDHNHSKLPKFDYMKSKDIHPEYFGKYDRQTRRSITPAGFANAFYKANN
jgi:hypothetical protein